MHKSKHRLRFLLYASLFFLCGFVYCLPDILNKHFQKVLNVTEPMAGSYIIKIKQI